MPFFSNKSFPATSSASIRQYQHREEMRSMHTIKGGGQSEGGGHRNTLGWTQAEEDLLTVKFYKTVR